MGRLIVVTLIAVETLVAGAIVSCCLQTSDALVRSRALGAVASSIVRSGRLVVASSQRLTASTRRIAVDGLHVRFTIRDDA